MRLPTSEPTGYIAPTLHVTHRRPVRDIPDGGGRAATGCRTPVLTSWRVHNSSVIAPKEQS